MSVSLSTHTRDYVPRGFCLPGSGRRRRPSCCVCRRGPSSRGRLRRPDFSVFWERVPSRGLCAQPSLGLYASPHSCGAWCAAHPGPRGADVQRSELQDSEVRVSGSLFGQVSGISLFFSKLFRRLRVLRKHCVVGFLPAGGGPREGRRLEVSAGEELRDVWLRECRSPPPVCVKGTWRRPHQALQMGAQPKGSVEEGARRKDLSDSPTPPPSPGDSTHRAQPSGALLEHLHRKIKKTKSPHLSFF